MDKKEMIQTKAEVVVIDSDRAGQRLDNFLISRLKGLPKSRIYKMFRKGEVRINKGRTKPGYKLAEGDLVRIPPVRLSESNELSFPLERLKRTLEERILFENERLLILNKPSGMAVHGGSGLSYGVIEALRAIRPKQHFFELVHRLDRETSGCLVVAKKRSSLRELHALFRSSDVDKRYIALLCGRFTPKYRLIDAPLLKNTRIGGERMVTVSPDGKPSQTEFRVRRELSNNTLVEAKLRTGRTHQIRVHAAFAGHPIAGDDRYGNDELNKTFRQAGLKRLFLHAAKVSFKLTSSGDQISVEAPLDKELSEFLDSLND